MGGRRGEAESHSGVDAHVVGVPNDAVKVGDPVEVLFDPVTPEVSLPKFRPAKRSP